MLSKLLQNDRALLHTLQIVVSVNRCQKISPNCSISSLIQSWLYLESDLWKSSLDYSSFVSPLASESVDLFEEGENSQPLTIPQSTRDCIIKELEHTGMLVPDVCSSVCQLSL